MSDASLASNIARLTATQRRRVRLWMVSLFGAMLLDGVFMGVCVFTPLAGRLGPGWVVSANVVTLVAVIGFCRLAGRRIEAILRSVPSPDGAGTG